MAATLDEALLAAAQPRVPLFDRELSWLQFNRRVVSEAENAEVPLLERVKFLAIASRNLDEFLMIRVGELRDFIAAGDWQQVAKLALIRAEIRRLLDDMYGCLDALGLGIERGARDDALFEQSLEPVLTPVAIEAGQPFPFIVNRALHLALRLESEQGQARVVVVKISDVLPRLVKRGETWALLEDLIASCIDRCFPGLTLRSSVAFRAIRNSDMSIKEDDAEDILQVVETEVRRRERREVVWLEVERGGDAEMIELLREGTQTAEEDVYVAPGPLRIADLMMLHDAGDPRLKDPPFVPRMPARLATGENIFDVIRQGDILLHRPYESFAAVVELLQTAADDPDVVAIKQTLYRSDPESPVVEALARAAECGKDVTAVVELQARFDEMKNITWARHLEDAGAQVVFGIAGLKTHCKTALIVRREGGALRRYVHLSTGNYNAITARQYTDLDLMTCDPSFGADAAQLMNFLTARAAPEWRELVVAPMNYRDWVLAMIERETGHARDGRPARIAAKMNALADPLAIAALYAAADAGVRIELMVRGICCLVPRARIRVLSVIDRFLEHARVFRFENGGDAEVYVSSGDWMVRNFVRRVEVTWPIRSEALARRIEEQILPIAFADNVKGWELHADGHYSRIERDGSPAVRSQEAFLAMSDSQSLTAASRG